MLAEAVLAGDAERVRSILTVAPKLVKASVSLADETMPVALGTY